MAKLCELKVNTFTDRNNVITALVSAGYKVSVEEREVSNYSYKRDFFVIVEDGSSQDD